MMRAASGRFAASTISAASSAAFPSGDNRFALNALPDPALDACTQAARRGDWSRAAHLFPNAAGVRVHLGVPAFYIDSIDALLLPSRTRLRQALAGPWAEWLFTSVVAMVVAWSPVVWARPKRRR